MIRESGDSLPAKSVVATIVRWVGFYFYALNSGDKAAVLEFFVLSLGQKRGSGPIGWKIIPRAAHQRYQTLT